MEEGRVVDEDPMISEEIRITGIVRTKGVCSWSVVCSSFRVHCTDRVFSVACPVHRRRASGLCNLAPTLHIRCTMRRLLWYGCGCLIDAGGTNHRILAGQGM